MIRRCMFIIVLLALVAVPVSAQLLVIDPGNLAQVVLMAERAQQMVEQIQAEYQLLTRMARGLGTLDPYRIPAIGLTALDATNFPYGRAWIDGLNGGDPRGTAYFSTAVPLQRPERLLDRLRTRARRGVGKPHSTPQKSRPGAGVGGQQIRLVARGIR